jgi:uncharacterized DUF497 family protein
MPLQYDPKKAAANLKKHGISFADAEGVLSDPLAMTIEDYDAEGEPRFVSIGLGSAGGAGGRVHGAKWRVSTDLRSPTYAAGAERL